VDSEGLSFGLQLRGGLFLFNNNKYFAHGIEEAELLKSYGVEAHILSVAETRAIEPGISAAVIGGIVYPQDAHLIPDQFVQQLAEKVIQSGVKIEESTGVLEIRVKNNRITEVVTASETYTPDHVVLAAGVWSVPIAQKLGIELPVQPAKGYSMTIKRPPESPDLPLVLAERKVVMTPMGDSLRIAGTLELAGFNPTINARRVNAIRSAVPAYLNSKIAFEESLAWFGYRPLTPDTLPIIGPSLDVNNLVIATGHGMLGMSLGPITGKLVSQIINGDSMGFDTTQLNLRRFAWNPRSPGE
jgi:D-amino-acid dehydrogenase